MVGIVVVSHSRDIASGTVALAGQMAGPEVRIEGAGGTPDGGLGTDAELVRKAIAHADQGDGVIVLGESCIAAPIIDHTGEAVGAIGVVGDTAELLPRAPAKGVVNAVAEAARAISRELGASRIAATFPADD